LLIRENYRINLQAEEAITDFLCAVLRGDSLDWPAASDTDFYDVLLKQASYHGVDSLLCHMLKPTAAWEELPDQLQDALQQKLMTGVACEMVRTRDLLALLEALSGAGIACLILKGGALAYTHYPEPGLRSRCDTDFFIDTGDIRKIRDIFHGLGYQLSGWIYKSHQFDCFKSEFGGAINYDIHWRPNNRSKYARVFSYEEVNRESVPVPGLDGALTLKPVHALLLACMHRAGDPMHDADRLIWLYDIHLLVSALSEPELFEFAQRAVGENIQAICRDAIEKSRQCFTTSVPGQVEDILAAPSQASSIHRRFSDSQLALIFDDIRQLPDVRSRFELVWEYLVPPADYLLNRYGKKGWFWVPALYLRYLFGGIFERVSLR